VKRRRHWKAFVVVGALASACASETVELPPPAPAHWQAAASRAAASPTTPTERERGLAQAYLKALASPGLIEIALLVDDDVRFAFGARNSRGRRAALKAHAEVFGAFDDRAFVTNRVWLTDSTHPLDCQAVEWTMTGTQARPWMGVAATNKPVAIKGITLFWTDDDGIISELHMYFDEAVVKSQLGGEPAELQKLQPPAVLPATTQVRERGGTPEEAASVTTARQMIEALEDPSDVAFLSTLADDFTLEALDTAESIRGRDEARTYFRAMRRAVRQLDTVVQNAWGVGSFAIVEYAVTGLQIAPLPRVHFAGDGALHQLHAQFVDVVELRAGKIARISRYSDPSSFASL
jgi:steroid delta-isomerase-like uncharacterized protein